MPLPLNTTGSSTGTPLSFAVKDPNHLLTQDDLNWLREVDYFDYPLIKYANLAALHREVSVEISPDTPKYPDEKVEMTVAEVEQAIEQLEAEKRDLKDHPENHPDSERERSAISSLLEIYKKALRRAQNEGKGPDDRVTIVFKGGLLLGEYIRCNPFDHPKVVLYVKNMGWWKNQCNRESLLSTYVHEMMHAYYDTNKSLTSDEHYIPCLEEPLAELGMLRFMQVFESKYSGIYSHALWNVKQKKCVPSMCFYGFGAYLNEELKDKVLPELLYRASKPIDSPELLGYTNVWKRHKYPFNNEARTAEMMFAVFGCAYRTTARNLSDKWFILSDDGKRVVGTIPYRTGKFTDNITAPTDTLYIPQGVEIILDRVFLPEYDKYVRKLIFPVTFQTIQAHSFHNLQNLQTLDFSECRSITILANEMFKGIETLKSVELPPLVTTIGSSAFAGCTNLQSIVIPKSVETIADGAFRDCSGLTSITIKGAVTTIGSNAFAGCSGLKQITIPNSVTSIGDGAFSGCRSLSEITIPDSVKKISNSAFSGCRSLTSIRIHNSVISIGNSAFDGCRGLSERFNIPQGVTSIGNGAFAGCLGLTSITINDAVTTIGSSAFAGCTNLQSINIPDSVKNIGKNAFDNCTNIDKQIFSYDKQKISINLDGTLLVHMYIGDDFVQESAPSRFFYSQTRAFKPFDNLGDLQSYITDHNNQGVQALVHFSATQNTWRVDNIQYLEVNKQSVDFLSKFAQLDNRTKIHICDDYDGDLSGYKNILLCCDSFAHFDKLGDDIELEIASSVNVINITTLSRNASKISTIKVDDGNSTYYTKDNCLYNKKSKSLLFCGNNVKSVSIYTDTDWELITGLKESLEEIIIEDRCKISIPKSQFAKFKNLKRVNLGSSVTSIGDSAFSGCSGLEEIIIPNSVTEIGDSAFSGCSGLTSISIPDSVTTIGFCAFEGCSGLQTIEVSVGNNQYDSRDNCNAIIDKTTNTLIVGCKDTSNQINVTRIADYAFSGCSGLTNVNIIPKEVESIGISAFAGCSGLKDINIPNSVTSIEDYAFKGCSGLKSITIFNDLIVIVNSAFADCLNLGKIIVPKGKQSRFAKMDGFKNKEIKEFKGSDSRKIIQTN